MTESYLDKALRESREREERATAGPWFTLQKPWTDDDGEGRAVFNSQDPHMGECVADCQLTMEWDADDDDPFRHDRGNAHFIAHARTWEPRFRRMVEVALRQIAFQKCYCDERRKYKPFDPCSRCRALEELEAIAKEGVTG